MSGDTSRDDIVAAIAAASDERESAVEPESHKNEPEVTVASADADDLPRSRFLGPVLVAALGVGLVLLLVLSVMVHRERVANDRADAAVKKVGTSLTRLLSWRSQSVEAELDDELKLLHGDFAGDYENLVRETIAPAARKAKLDATAEIVASGVVDRPSADKIVLLYFVNVDVVPSGGAAKSSPSQTSPTDNNMGSRIKVTAVEIDGTWLIEKYDPI